MVEEIGDNRGSSKAGSAVRRGLLRSLAGSVATVAFGGIGGGAASAKQRKSKQSICKSCPKICETRDLVLCRPSADVSMEACVCARTTTGDSTCVNIAPRLVCSATNQCFRDADCPADHACIKVDDVNCCPPPHAGDPAPTGNQCAPICKPGR